MIAIDTNVVVRALNNDDPDQSRRAIELIGAHEVFISKTVVVETEWVLRDAYALDPATIRSSLLRLFGLPNVVVEDRDQVLAAIRLNEQGIDFADALHHAAAHEADSFRTFDAQFVRRSARLGLRPSVRKV